MPTATSTSTTSAPGDRSFWATAIPSVLDALNHAITRGTSFGAPTEQEIELAETVREMFPSIEMVRLVNSGTEATMSALRVARGFTNRDLTIKFEGCYHGHVDSLLVKAGSGVATLGLPDSPGVPKGFSDTTLTVPFNDIDAVEAAFRAHRDKIAAVIVEPVCGNMGCIPPNAGFLEALRRITADNDALLIFDEVMTGFRVAPGGAQQLYGITPDLTTLGKVIGGGLPIAAYGGRRDIMISRRAQRPDLPGGHAVRQSARGERRAGRHPPPPGASGNLRPAESLHRRAGCLRARGTSR